MGQLNKLASACLLMLAAVAAVPVSAQAGSGGKAEASGAAAPRIGKWSPYIDEASARFGVPGEWIVRVIRAESGGRTMLGGRPITSRAGAMGLMQLMPGTWAEMRAAHGLGSDPYDPRDNILAGTAYLREMYERFGYPGLFAAYNAGPARFARHLASGRGLPAETLAYAAALSASAEPRTAPAGTAGYGAGIFVLIAGAGERPRDAPSRAPDPDPDSLFALLGTRAPD
jgi:soluble lytic murein transglycosylase-like protein